MNRKGFGLSRYVMHVGNAPAFFCMNAIIIDLHYVFFAILVIQHRYNVRPMLSINSYVADTYRILAPRKEDKIQVPNLFGSLYVLPVIHYQLR